MDTIKTPKKEVIEAYYMVPKNGGFLLRKLTIEEDVVLEDNPVGDPDAWNQVMSEVEHEFSKKLQERNLPDKKFQSAVPTA